MRVKARNSTELKSTLIATYAKCGRVEEAEELFNLLYLQEELDVIIWNAIIDVYGKHRMIDKVCVRIISICSTQTTK